MKKRVLMLMEREFNTTYHMIDYYRSTINNGGMKTEYNNYISYCAALMDVYTDNEVENNYFDYMSELDSLFA